MENDFFAFLDAVNGIMLSVPVLLALLLVGILFTFWSGFIQYRAVTHGVGLISGKWTSGKGAGVISHFQALSAALSATVGLGNIAGVAIAVELGGPGAVFWMWVVGFFGMAIKATEVMLSMLYRDTSDPENPHGGTMWVASRGFAEISPRLKGLGGLVGGLFCIPLILFAFTGGNMFQSWSVGDTTREYFGIAPWISGAILAAVVGLVILGGIKRIGRIAGTLVPFMCFIYVAAGVFVLFVNAEQLPDVFRLIFTSAFSSAEAGGAFVGASVGMAFIFGMKRALFSSEAGMGSAPIAHSAVKTREPVTEGIVGGLEPFVDTLVVCTITALVILSSGVWNRDAIAQWDTAPAFLDTGAGWTLAEGNIPADAQGQLSVGNKVFAVVSSTGERKRLFGTAVESDNGLQIKWGAVEALSAPVFAEAGLFADYTGSTLTARAFDSAADGLGQWMVTLAVWLFAISTAITWSYYGEQGVVYLVGNAGVLPYRLTYCLLLLVACLGIVDTARELDSLSTIALGFMVAINLPIIVLLGSRAMAAYRDYVERLKTGDIHP